MELVCDGLGDDFDFSVTVAGEDRGLGLGFVVERGGACVVVVRRSVVVGVTVLPGVVTVSDEAVVVVVVVVVRSFPSMRRRTKFAGASRTRNEVTATSCAVRQPGSRARPRSSNPTRFTRYI